MVVSCAFRYVRGGIVRLRGDRGFLYCRDPRKNQAKEAIHPPPLQVDERRLIVLHTFRFLHLRSALDRLLLCSWCYRESYW